MSWTPIFLAGAVALAALATFLAGAAALISCTLAIVFLGLGISWFFASKRF